VKRTNQLALVRELWSARDELARARDVAAGRLLNDRAIISCALKTPSSLTQLAGIPAFKKDAAHWWSALERARANPTLPKPQPSEGPPSQIRIWRERAPIAYARLTHAKARLQLTASEVELPVENLLSPDILRHFCWQDPPPGGRSEGQVADFLSERGARRWQISLTAPLLREIEGEVEPVAIAAEGSEPESAEVSDLS
jgi:ribonuclease D